MDNRYERIITAALALAREADYFGEQEEAGSVEFFDLAAELYGAVVRATAEHLPEVVLEMLCDRADVIAARRIFDDDSGRGPGIVTVQLRGA